MDKSKRILLFTTAYDPFIGGSEIAIRETIKRIPDLYFDILTSRLDKKLPKIQRGDNYCIHRLGFGMMADKLFFPFVGFNYAKQLLRQNEYGAMHVFQASHAAGAAWRIKLHNKNLPMIVTLQEGKNLDDQSGIIRFARKLIIKKADLVTAISHYLKQYAGSFKNNESVILIPNGVDITNFGQDFRYGELLGIKDKFGIKPDDKVVISVSRLVPKNNMGALIRSFSLLNPHSKDRPLKLLLVGSGPEEMNLRSLANNLKLHDKVIFAGDIGHEELPKILKISDVFVRPSISEGLGVSFLEAMAGGVPVIGTKVGGIPDFLKNKKTGLFCLAEDPADISKKINLVITNKELRDGLIINAKELVTSEYDWDKIAGKYKMIYNNFE